jgi:hypothetical protein
MIELEVAEGPGEPLPLDLRTVRGAGDAPAHLDRLIVLGQPQSAHLTPERAKDDVDLVRFIEANADRWHYHLVAFSCTFSPTENQHIVASWVQIALANHDDPDAPAPIATSMEPSKLEQARPLSLTAKIGVPAVLNTELGVTNAKESRRIYLEARYEGTERPAWHFTENGAGGVKGMQRLRMIVRVAANVAAIGVLTAGATVRHQNTGLKKFTYRTRSPYKIPGPSFLLPHTGQAQG